MMGEEKEKTEEQSLISIETIKKERINKILIFVTLATVVSVSSSIAAMFVINSAKNKKERIESENIANMMQETQEVQKDAVKLSLPVYSEEAKERMKNIYASDDGEKVAYLTFDDGPSENITPQILETLRSQGVKATFFVLGSRVEIYPNLVKQEYEEGHYIANHGYSHIYTSVYGSAWAVLNEYNNTDRIIREAIGNDQYISHLFRFPGGSEGGNYTDIKNEAKVLLEQNNIAYINWNCLTNDAVGTPTHESLIENLKATSNRKKQNSYIDA